MKRLAAENRWRMMELARELNRLKRDAGGNGHVALVTVAGLRGVAEVDYSALYGWRCRVQGGVWTRRRWRSAANAARWIVETLEKAGGREE